MTPMRVASVIASSWSWVTTMKVTPSCLLDVDELELRVLAQLLVERAERLVEQQQLRPLDQRARQRHALPLAARELVRLALRELRPSLHELEDLARRASSISRLRHLVLLEAERDVLLTVMCGNSA